MNISNILLTTEDDKCQSSKCEKAGGMCTKKCKSKPIKGAKCHKKCGICCPTSGGEKFFYLYYRT